MRFYEITKGQFITLWFFGVILWIYLLARATEYSGNDGFVIASIALPAILIFYTVGWRRARKEEGTAQRSRDKCKKRRMWYALAGIGALLIVGALAGDKIADRILTDFELLGYTPSNYELVESYSDDFDGDGKNEMLLLFEEAKYYNSNSVKETEGFRTLPVMVRVLDYRRGSWRVSDVLEVDDDSWQSTFFYSPYFAKGLPYTIYQMEDEQILGLFHYQASFDGISYEVDFFRVGAEVGQDRIGSVALSRGGIARVDIGDYSSFDQITQHDDHLYFVACNPFTGQEEMKIQRLKTTGSFLGETLTSRADVLCEDYWDLGSSPYDQKDEDSLEGARSLSSFLENQGVYDL